MFVNQPKWKVVSKQCFEMKFHNQLFDELKIMSYNKYIDLSIEIQILII